MYCVKCGVELADSERKCPLCSTPVYYPGLEEEPQERTYPKYEGPEAVNPRGIYFIITFVCLIAAVISFVCDLQLIQGIKWSGYAIGGIVLTYVMFVLPGWFKKYNPAIFIPVNFAAVGLYLFYINLATGGNWFMTFAFPVTGMATLIVSSITILSYYLKKGYLYIWGGAFIVAAACMPIMEILANITFSARDYLLWCYYPTIGLGLIGIMLIIIALVKPFRESLKKTFSI